MARGAAAPLLGRRWCRTVDHPPNITEPDHLRLISDPPKPSQSPIQILGIPHKPYYNHYYPPIDTSPHRSYRTGNLSASSNLRSCLPTAKFHSWPRPYPRPNPRCTPWGNSDPDKGRRTLYPPLQEH